MQVTMHVVLDNYTELAQFSSVLAQINGAKNIAAPTTPVAPVAQNANPDKKPTFEQKMAAKGEQTAKPAKAAAEPAPSEEKSPSPLDPTYPNMKKAVLLVSQIRGRVAAETILKKYGAEKIGPSIDEKHFANIIADCNAALA